MEVQIKRRAQESIAFIIVIGGAMFLFLIFANLIRIDLDASVTIEGITKTRTATDTVAKAVFRSFTHGPGTVENITLNDDADYDILIRPDSITAVMPAGNTYTISIMTSQVIEHNISSGYYQVTNIDGWVNVNAI